MPLSAEFGGIRSICSLGQITLQDLEVQNEPLTKYLSSQIQNARGLETAIDLSSQAYALLLAHLPIFFSFLKEEQYQRTLDTISYDFNLPCKKPHIHLLMASPRYWWPTVAFCFDVPGYISAFVDGVLFSRIKTGDSPSGSVLRRLGRAVPWYFRDDLARNAVLSKPNLDFASEKRRYCVHIIRC